jgi:tetratricopeptide (TPR) repeat protein
MRNEAEPAERRWVVRHLIAGCARCLAVTSGLWTLADPPGSLDPGVAGAGLPAAAAGAADAANADGEGSAEAAARRFRRRRPRPAREAHGERTAALFERLADAGRRIEEERRQAPRLAAELLASPPAVSASVAGPPGPALLARPELLTAAVCEELLDRSREAAAVEADLALRAAELALAIAERLDQAVCGATVAKGLRVRAWAHVAQARRLHDDLDGAEWALALAESLARELAELPAEPGKSGGGGVETAAGILPFVPAEWAELLVFKAGLFADRGDLRGADRLLGHAAELFHAGAEPQRAGRTLVQQGLIRADLGDHERAAEALRAGVDLLDPVAEPGLVAANLHRLAALLRGIALAAQDHGDEDDGEHAKDHGLPAQRSLKEALRLVRRARTLYRSLGEPTAEAHLTRLQGQIEAALGDLEDAEASLAAATAALAEHGCGREATLAQIDLALVLVHQGRAADVRRLGLDRWPLLQARDKSWKWVAAVLVFQVLAAGVAREPAGPATAKLLGELARYLAPRAAHTPLHYLDSRRRR